MRESSARIIDAIDLRYTYGILEFVCFICANVMVATLLGRSEFYGQLLTKKRIVYFLVLPYFLKKLMKRRRLEVVIQL